MTTQSRGRRAINSAAIASCGVAMAAQSLEQSAPLQWAREPHAMVSHTVAMAVERLTVQGGVEYRFECTDGQARDSGWQESPEYVVSNLSANTAYTFVAKARAKAGKGLLRTPARPVSVTTRRDRDHARVKHTLIDQALTSGELELIPLYITGDKDNRINIVVVNRWEKGQRNAYNRPEMREDFVEDARHVLEAFATDSDETMPPYPNYRQFFNVWAVWWPGVPPWGPQDRENGMHWEDYNEIRARFFLPWQTEGKGWVTHLAMFNSRGGGGGAGRNLDERVGDAMIVGNRVTSFIHEFNHTAPGIPDEYTSSGMWGRGGEGSTTTNEYRREFVKWRAWIDPDTPVPTPYSPEYANRVGVFEGGVHRMAHLYRPTARGCIMGAGSFAGNAKQMCPVCRQRAVERFYEWIDTIEEALPQQRDIVLDKPATLSFAVKRVAPEPDTQKTEWRLNGKPIATDTDTVEVKFGANTANELVFALVDESPFIREDPPFARYPRAETRWAVRVGEAERIAEPAPAEEPVVAPVVKPPPNTPPGFTLGPLRFEAVDSKAVRIVEPSPDYRYHWYASDYPDHIPRFPHGTYGGTFTPTDGQPCQADAYVIQNKGGMFLDERCDKNDFGHWIHLMAWPRGRQCDPITVDVNTRQKGRLAGTLTVAGHIHERTTWSGSVAEEKMRIAGVGPAGGVFDLHLVSFPDSEEEPLATGTEFSPKRPGNYYVAAQRVDTGAASRNRIGLAVSMGERPKRNPLPPDGVTGGKLLIWLDASDMDADGHEDALPPRRGAVMGWQGKAAGVDFRDFVFYQPNVQNGKGVASWKTIWIQSLSDTVTGFRTLFMVRREHDYSSVGTAPWRDLSPLIGVGEYGKRLLSQDASKALCDGAVYLDGRKVDMASEPMPTDFYLVAYEFPEPVTRGFRTTDGHWEGDVAECLAFDAVLSTEEREGVEQYLRAKWFSGVHLDDPAPTERE